nr:MAG TPA: hypothetical protein [Caudoviricetes sp.]
MYFVNIKNNYFSTAVVLSIILRIIMVYESEVAQ